MNSHNLTAEQQAMVEVWERHLAAEFEEKSIDAYFATEYLLCRPSQNPTPHGSVVRVLCY